MTRISVITFVSTVIIGMFFMVGCRVHHLGDSHGKAYHEALNEQAAGEGKVDPTPMSATDAKRVMRVHATGEDKGGDKAGSSTTTTIPSPMSSTSSGSLGGGKWPGSSGNINLEAK